MMTGGHISSQKPHEHALLEAELRRALEATSPITLMRSALEGEGGAEPAWRAVVATGSLHFVLDAPDGGLGLDWTMLAVVARELGRVLSPTAFAGAAVALRLIAEGGNETVRDRWLQPGMSGDARGCMAIVEREGAFTEPAARLHSDRLFGSKLAVAGAEQADFAIVSCLDDGHARLVVVDLSQPGILFGPPSTLDPTRGNASLTFDGAHAHKLDLAEEKLGWSRDVLATLVAAEQLGGAERCFEIALAYAKERRAFGRAIGSFQAVKQKMVDMFQRLQLARAHVAAAAQSLCAGGAEEGVVVAAAARISATDAFDFTAQEAIQIHGALGICWEHDCHLFLRRACLLALELGSALQWRRHLVSSLPPKAQISDRHRDSAEHARYRAEIHTWLASHNFGPKHDKVAQADFADPQVMRAGREWQKKKAAAGYAAIDWPAELGGGGKNPIEREIYAQEERRLATPPLNLFDIGLGMCGPTLIRFATDAQKRRLVPPLVKGEEIWCQLFSEPAAGSDLAGIGTRAHRQGDHWRIEGQKVWTSYAQYADWGLLLARSDPERPKHAGLTMFFLGMRSPGITVRPLRQLAGVAEFNEVFFDGVLIPDAQRLGEANEGWATALYTLMHERSFSGVGVDVEALLTVARTRPMNGRPAIDDPAVSERCADAWVAARGLDVLNSKAFAQLARGQEPGPEFSVGKLMAGTMNQAIARLMMDIGGPATLDAGAIDIQQDWLMSARTRLAGGSDEIMAVILAERVLGLPQEPRIDKGLAFSAIP